MNKNPFIALAAALSMSPTKDEKSHFEDDPLNQFCMDKSHNPPSHLYIPQGKRYVHVCPACGTRMVIRPINIS